jgi:hypothetical protein
VRVQQRRAELMRLQDEQRREAAAHDHLQQLVTDFHHRSALAREAIEQTRCIRALVTEASFAPPSEVGSDDDDDAGAPGAHDLDRARARAEASGYNSPQDSGIVLANALVDRQQAKHNKGPRQGQQQRPLRGNSEADLRLMYSRPVEVLDGEEANAHAKDIMDSVMRHEESRSVHAVVQSYQLKEKPEPPAFDSTALSIELDQLARQIDEVMQASESMLRSVMDSSGKSFQATIFDGDIARIRYHQDVCTDWLRSAGEHASRYTRGAQAVTDGVAGEISSIRKQVLEVKEECDLLARQCERKKVECDVAARRQEVVTTNTLLRQVLAAGWSHKSAALGPAAGAVRAPTATTSELGAAGKDPVPTLPARYVRVAALRLRHHLTTLQNALIRNVSPHDQHKDQQALEAIAAALDLLRSYENAHRDEELDIDATDELRRELLQGSANGAKRLTESSSIAMQGDTSAAATAAAEIELVESIAFSAMMSYQVLDDAPSRSESPTAEGGPRAASSCNTDPHPTRAWAGRRL